MDILEFDTGYFQKTDWFYLRTHTFTSADLSVNTTAYNGAMNNHVKRSKQNISTVCKSKFSFDCIFYNYWTARTSYTTSNVGDVKVGCWRRQRWAMILANRCHKAHGTWTNRIFETHTWWPFISGLWWYCLASHFSWPLDAQLLSWELLKAKVHAKTIRKLGWLQEHIRTKLEPVVWIEQLWLILDHDCKNAGESN